ncbi:type IV pili methyl-accepting chemotaxis transducer N-terminal domain-containing protein [Paucibacter sp. AS339]|uniref:type IV pili methyl-accepting chemotaxis transducer N-terminal domain-containing protein n=1 Tax=Paucibacter hankyongi TaxID=3133434 RepID=UPI0030B0E0AC
MTRQVEAAGRLRMLSQHVALLAHRASRDGSVELKQFENAVREFDVKLAELRAVEDADLDTAHIFALDRVEMQWQRLNSMPPLAMSVSCRSRATACDKSLRYVD